MTKKIFYTILLAVLLILSFSTGFYYQKSRNLEKTMNIGREGRDSKQGRLRMWRGHGKYIRDKRFDLFNLIKAQPPDTSKIYAKINEIVEIQRKIQKESVDSILIKLNLLEDHEREQYIHNLNSSFCFGKGNEFEKRKGRGEGRGRGKGRGLRQRQ